MSEAVTLLQDFQELSQLVQKRQKKRFVNRHFRSLKPYMQYSRKLRLNWQADVADRGIVLTGGGALLRGLEELIEEKTGINTMTAERPMTCVAIGTGKYVEFLSGKERRRDLKYSLKL